MERPYKTDIQNELIDFCSRYLETYGEWSSNGFLLRAFIFRNQIKIKFHKGRKAPREKDKAQTNAPYPETKRRGWTMYSEDTYQMRQ